MIGQKEGYAREGTGAGAGTPRKVSAPCEGTEEEWARKVIGGRNMRKIVTFLGTSPKEAAYTLDDQTY